MYFQYMARHYRWYNGQGRDLAIFASANRKVRRVNLSRIRKNLDAEEYKEAVKEIGELLDQEEQAKVQSNEEQCTFFYGPLVLTPDQADYLVTEQIPIMICAQQPLHLSVPQTSEFPRFKTTSSGS